MELSRRDFLGAAAFTAAGFGSLAVAGGLAGCAAPKQDAPKQDAPKGDEPKAADDGVQAGAAEPAPAAGEGLNPQSDYTACTTDFKPLFEPLTMGGVTLKNRIVKSPAGSDTWAPEGDALNDNFLDYYENFAKGGASLVFVESSIGKLMGFKPLEQTASGWLVSDMTKIPDLMAPVCERIHKHDSLAGFQLGMGMLNEETTVITDMTPENIQWLKDTIVELAVQLKAAGFDVMELHCAATQILKYFMMARVNKREDEYGAQNLENRTRFLCEVIAGIKEACGQDYPVQVLIDAVEENDAALGNNDGFLTLEESVANAQMLEKAGADSFYLRVSVPGRHIAQFAPDLMFSGYRSEGMTGFGTRADFSQHFGGIVDGEHSGAGMLISACEAYKKGLSKASVSAAGYMDPRTAPDLIVGAVADGKVDYLMITRPLTVDPEMPNKLAAGKRDEIAPCCRCLHCHSKGGPAEYANDGTEYCRVNAVTQRAYTEDIPEGYELLPAETKKKVMVVGGGPAGMEAARIAALRGHDVTLYEKSSSLGGLVNTAHAFKGDHERLGDLVDYLAHQQDVCGVSVVTGTEVTAETVEAESPDVVLVATGGKRETKLSGAGPVKVAGIADVAGADLGQRVVICGAGLQAVDIALYLLAQGKKVQLVHDQPKELIDKEQSMWVRAFVIPHLYAQGVKIWNNAQVGKVTDEGLSITIATGEQKVLACDTVLECYDMVPNTELADAIGSAAEVKCIGDCEAPCDIAMAIKAGHLAARAI